MKKTSLALILLGLAAVLGVVRISKAEDSKKASTEQNWYVIESKHTGPQCLQALDDMNSKKLLGKSYWACKSGDHRGWTILQAPSKEAAIKMLPESQRADAKIAEVGQFSDADLKAFHHG